MVTFKVQDILFNAVIYVLRYACFVPGPERSIIYSTGKTIRRISLDTDDLTSFILPIKYLSTTKLASFVVTKDQIIWTDGTKIYSSLKNGSGRGRRFRLFRNRFADPENIYKIVIT